MPAAPRRKSPSSSCSNHSNRQHSNHVSFEVGQFFNDEVLILNLGLGASVDLKRDNPVAWNSLFLIFAVRALKTGRLEAQ
jgi:hypothetical protein